MIEALSDIVQVHVSVKPGAVDAFRAATVANAAASRREPGVARFDVLQQNRSIIRSVRVCYPCLARELAKE